MQWEYKSQTVITSFINFSLEQLGKIKYGADLIWRSPKKN